MAIQQFSQKAKYVILAPAVVFLLALTVLPLLNLLLLSFNQVAWTSGKSVWTFVGIANYVKMGADPLLSAGVRNTAVLVVVATVIQVVLGLGLALLCSALGRRSSVYRTLFLLPILVPGIIIGAIWKLMYNPQFGVINQLIGVLGFDAVDWLGSPATALAAVIIVDIWHWTPFTFLLLLAAVESLPQDVGEAAKIDGASVWNEFRYITFPLLVPAIAVTAAFRAITAFKVFDEVFLLTAGGPGTSTEVISFTIYQRMFLQDDAGYGSAISVALIFVIAVIIVITLTRKSKEAA